MGKKIRAALVVILLSSLTFAFDYNIGWEPPTAYTDGAPLLEQDLDFYTLNCGTGVFVNIDSVIGQRTATVDLSFLPEGTHDCTMTVTTLTGVESGPSNTMVLIVGPRVPGAPTIVQLSLI